MDVVTISSKRVLCILGEGARFIEARFLRDMSFRTIWPTISECCEIIIVCRTGCWFIKVRTSEIYIFHMGISTIVDFIRTGM